MLVSLLLNFYLLFLTPSAQADNQCTSTSNNSQRCLQQTAVPRQSPPNRTNRNSSNLVRMLQKGMWHCFTLDAESKIVLLKIPMPNYQSSTVINQQTPSKQSDVVQDQTILHSKISNKNSIFKLLNQQRKVVICLAEIIKFLNEFADPSDKIYCKFNQNNDPRYHKRKEEIDRAFNYFSKAIVRYHAVISYYSKITDSSKGSIEKYTKAILNFYSVIISLENYVNMTLVCLRKCRQYFPVEEFNTYAKSCMTFKSFLVTNDAILFDFDETIVLVRVEYGFSIDIGASSDNTDNNAASNQSNNPLNEPTRITNQETTSNSHPSKKRKTDQIVPKDN